MVGRRQFLALSAAGVSVGAAGCFETIGADDGSDLPPYHSWLVRDGVDGASAFYANREREAAEGGYDGLETGPGYRPGPEDLVADYALRGSNADAEARDALDEYGLDSIADGDRGVGSPVDGIVGVGASLLLTGSFDPDEVGADLTAGGGGPRFELDGEVGEYDRYADEDGRTVAVDEEAVLLAKGGNAAGRVRSLIEADAGDRPRAYEEDDDLAWALETAGRGDLAFALFPEKRPATETDERGETDPAGPSDLVAGARVLVASLSLDDDAATGAFAMTVPGPDEKALEPFLGPSAAERSVTVEGDRVSAEATWPATDDE